MALVAQAAPPLATPRTRTAERKAKAIKTLQKWTRKQSAKKYHLANVAFQLSGDRKKGIATSAVSAFAGHGGPTRRKLSMWQETHVKLFAESRRHLKQNRHRSAHTKWLVGGALASRVGKDGTRQAAVPSRVQQHKQKIRRMSTEMVEIAEGDEEAVASADAGIGGSTADEQRSRAESVRCQLAMRHWLEATDLKHRYGTLLSKYHKKWMATATSESFFYWLDYGAGRGVDLAPACPRKKLEASSVKYMTAAEREFFRVIVHPKTKQLVYRQSGDVLHSDVGCGALCLCLCSLCGHTGRTVRRYQADLVEAGAAGASPSPPPLSDEARWWHRLLPTCFFWRVPVPLPDIFVMDTNGALFVARKQRGRFHHSSFLGGAVTRAAGALVVHNGTLRLLTGHSGHYRPPKGVLARVKEELRAQGADVSRVLVQEPKGHKKKKGGGAFRGPGSGPGGMSGRNRAEAINYSRATSDLAAEAGEGGGGGGGGETGAGGRV